MLATALRRATTNTTARSAAAKAAIQRVPSTAQHSGKPRQFSSTIRRPKAIKVKKSEARRRVEPKPASSESNALVEQQEYSQVPAQYPQSGPFAPQQAPTSFGGMLKESFFWGIGMAIAMTFVGVVFGRMEETDTPDQYDESDVFTEDRTISTDDK